VASAHPSKSAQKPLLISVKLTAGGAGVGGAWISPPPQPQHISDDMKSASSQ
jgi:hypothetical protein